MKEIEGKHEKLPDPHFKLSRISDGMFKREYIYVYEWRLRLYGSSDIRAVLLSHNKITVGSIVRPTDQMYPLTSGCGYYDNAVVVNTGLQYIVWTQAGFKKAVRTLHLVNDDDDPVENYPKQYPCVIDFIACYRGYHYWYARCTPLNKAIETARNTLQMLINADAEHRANAQQTGSPT